MIIHSREAYLCLVKSKWIAYGINLLFWLLTAWLIISGFSIETQEVEIQNGEQTVTTIRNSTMIVKLLFTISLAVIMFYLNLWTILQLRQKFHLKKTVALSLALLISFVALYYLLESLLFSYDSLKLPMSLSHGIFVFYYSISIAYGVGMVWLFTENKHQRMALEKKQTELSLLRNQLQPHFLFNALNNLLSMVQQEKNPVLADSIGKLSGLLRYVVEEVSSEKVPIRKEIDFIKNFVALQLLRFEKEEVIFNLNIQGNYDQQPIEPGIFIPFVENAFKYGAEPEKQSTIDISFDLSQDGSVLFSISNPIYPVLQKANGSGTGIASAKKRLALVYPNQHQLSITENDRYLVSLKINTNESNHSR